ncbi:flippase [Campylobacter concisus]|uniref:flippase n=2 Tax=Campylobacter concisus TaxID=199 RepID=UPI0021565AAC|nr:flippase [Campylobacter concisus]
MIDKIISLKNHQGFMKYFKNTSWLFFEKILRMLVGLFVGIWVTRYLGPERFGLFSYAQSFVGLFAAIATLGLDGIVVREIVKDESKATELIGTAFYLKLMGAVVTLLVLVIATQFTSNNRYTNLLVFIIASATIFQSFNVVDMYFQSKVLSKYAVFSNIISLFISSIVKITLILINAPLVAFAWAILFDSVVLAMGFIYFFLKYSTCEIKKIKFNKTIAISLLKDSWPLILSGVVISIYMKIDQVMIQEILGNEAVGQYAAATRLSEIWYFIPTILVSSLFPAVVNARKQSEELYYSRLQKLFDLVVWIAIAIALPMTFLSDIIVNMLYGEQYNQAASVLTIHIWASIFVFLGVASGQWFIAENLQLLAFWRTFCGMVTNIFLNLLLITKFGIKGVAIATLVSYMIAGFMFDFASYKLRRIFFMKLNTINPRRIW